MKGLIRIVPTGIVVTVIALVVWGWLALASSVPPGKEGPWGGVDTNVIEKYAADAGREAGGPFIDTDQGDLLLFVFTLSGAIAGFAAGYYWRRLITERS